MTDGSQRPPAAPRPDPKLARLEAAIMREVSSLEDYARECEGLTVDVLYGTASRLRAVVDTLFDRWLESTPGPAAPAPLPDSLETMRAEWDKRFPFTSAIAGDPYAAAGFVERMFAAWQLERDAKVQLCKELAAVLGAAPAPLDSIIIEDMATVLKAAEVENELRYRVRRFLAYIADVRVGRVKRLDRDVVLSLAADIERTL